MIHAKKIIIRTKKEDSAFLYYILEAQEGLTAYSTLNYVPHDPFRDVELIFSPELEKDVRALLVDLADILVPLPESA